MYECRCDERLKVKAEGSTRLTYTGLCGPKDLSQHESEDRGCGESVGLYTVYIRE